jgi:hypothetical protein
MKPRLTVVVLSNYKKLHAVDLGDNIVKLYLTEP